MHAVATLFDKKNDRLIRSLWKDLEEKFRLRGVYKTPIPHFSYQIASDYVFDRLQLKLEKFAGRSHSFTVHARGLAFFAEPHPVLYIPIVKTTELSKFQEILWKKLASISKGVPKYYGPELWVPHITLAQHDVNKRNLPKIIAWLSEKKLDLEIDVNNFAIIFDDGTSQRVHSEFLFG
jgi:2'-5' RNA ligase